MNRRQEAPAGEPEPASLDHTPAAPAARRWIALGVSLGVCFAVAGLNGAVTAGAVDGWYRQLAKPVFNPPDWLFPPVWNVLFALMAVAAWRIWERVPAGVLRRTALALFALQLGANLLWSVLFFGLQQPGAALLELVVLEALVVITAVVFWRHDRVAGLLLVPYALWGGFAGALNAGIWWLN